MKNPSSLFVTLGYPGSGKSYFSERLAKDIGAFHLNSDKVRADMFTNPAYTREEHEAVFKMMDHRCEELLSKGISVIYDANNNRRSKRKELQALADKYSAKYLLLYFKTPIEIAKERNEQRQGLAKVRASVIDRMDRLIEPPLDNEPFMEIDGTQDVDSFLLKSYSIGN